MNRLITFFVVLMLLTPEMSVKTSYTLFGGAVYSPWMIDLGPFSLVDYFVIFLIVFSSIVKLRFLPIGHYFYFSAFFASFLFIGGIYNLSRDFVPKPFFYDLKWFLYFITPFLLSITFPKVISFFSVKRILVILFLCSLIDILYVSYVDCCHELVTIFGFTPLPEVLPTCVFVACFFYGYERKTMLTLIIFQTINSINTLALNQLFLSLCFASIAFIDIIFKKFFRRFIFTLSIGVFYFVLPIYLIVSPPSILSLKADGASTRYIQLLNLRDNFYDTTYGIIGNGLGATYKEFHLVDREDIYSVGKSISSSQSESMSSSVKFVFNVIPAGSLYKFGILGCFLLTFLISGILPQKKGVFALAYLGVIVLLFPGFIKLTFVFSMLLLILTNEVQDEKNPS